MNIYTFYEKIDGFNESSQLDLIKIWKKSWSYYGWNPVVLDMKDVIMHPLYEKLKNACSKFPTINNSTYELYCFLRWLSMEKRGGWFTDYDIINYGFEPFDYGNKIVTTSYQIGGSTIYGPVEFYKNIIDIILTHKITDSDFIDINGIKTPHISDMHLLSHALLKKLINVDECLYQEKCYGLEEYQKYKLIHYANTYIPKNKTRLDVIKEDPRSLNFIE